jgi:hypothetical protein
MEKIKGITIIARTHELNISNDLEERDLRADGKIKKSSIIQSSHFMHGGIVDRHW